MDSLQGYGFLRNDTYFRGGTSVGGQYLRIGIIGAGNIGQALARLAVANGHAVTLSNSRGPDTLRTLVAEIGCEAGSVTDLPRSSDIVMLTVPLTAAFQLPPDLLDGRIVIDTDNYYPDRDGKIDALDTRQTTTAQMIASHFPGATIVKAFNAILAQNLLGPVALPNGAKRALPIAGDNGAAKALVTTPIADILARAFVQSGPSAYRAPG